ncbi:SulP family sulfate permease [Roseibium hamelinense]|uniref:SulP family sulfate permease n=1 Tax=Roseibium hamelinense TaxID=150831 RepID=A0A562T164_9HYPH|nr:sulfate permease [Roseibium hamelinense]MTI44721.1 sulfate permease [Roseibium hamelinense]TWI87351.1 SulP family sulfate permease [Roseibium hamelinense]
MNAVLKYFPILDWGKSYNKETAISDLVAAVIVTIMLIPQSLAYALLAGLPPEIGLYASILPLVAYAVFGTSRALAVGPVAVVSLMTASAVGELASQGTPEYLGAAIALAFLSGLMLVAMGLLRLGFLANLLSHPVISGFITASGLLIASSQLKHILGIPASGHTLLEILQSIFLHLSSISWITFAIGAAATVFLFWVRKGLKPALISAGFKPFAADILTKAGPVAAVAATTALAAALDLGSQGVRLVGDIPSGLPVPQLPRFESELWLALAGPALLISVIGFVESVSVAQTLAAKKRQRIAPDQELIGLGTSNIASAISGGYPVTGGFARSVVNFDAGAATPAAGAFTAIGIALATLFLTPLLTNLPQATLAATIIVAVLSLVDFAAIKRTFDYSKSDFVSMAATILITLFFGVEKGIVTGVGLSIALYLYRNSRPHMAVVGIVPGTEHFRNIDRHKVATGERVLSVRVDESLFFANSRYLEDKIYALVAAKPDIEHVVLMCPAINEIDASALESLEEINHRLSDSRVQFHLSEVKGPVMDRLQKTPFLEHLTGQVFLSQYDALCTLDPLTAHISEARTPKKTAQSDVWSGPEI